MAAIKKKAAKKKTVKKVVKKKAAVKKRSTRKPIKKKAGRPLELTEEVALELCDRLVREGSLRTVCNAVDMPDKSSVFRWLLIAEKEDCDEIYQLFKDQYIRARELSKDYKFDELDHNLKDLAYEPVVIGGKVVMEDGKPVMHMTSQSVSFAKLHLDSFKWQASKENPKKYGDKLQTDITSNGKTIKNEWHVHPVSTQKDAKED